jgi:cytochrome P450
LSPANTIFAFSAGPRACIGASFAPVLKICDNDASAVSLQHDSRSRIDRVIRITMGPREGLPMTIHPNDRKFAASEVRGQIHEMVQMSP